MTLAPVTMATNDRRLLLLLVAAAICVSVGAFNLEARLPIVKSGAAGSYFGYSVAEHVTSNKSDSTKW